jgi:hypothetical protein
MRIGGIIRDAGFHPKITRDVDQLHGDMVFLSLYSTLHLLDPTILARVQKFSVKEECA